MTHYSCSSGCFLTHGLFPPLPPPYPRMGIADPDPRHARRGGNLGLGQWSTRRVVSTQQEFEPSTSIIFLDEDPVPHFPIKTSPVMSQHLQATIQLIWPRIENWAPLILLSSQNLLVHPPLPAKRSKLTVPKRALRTLLLLTMAPAGPSPRYLSPLLHLANSYSSFRIQVEPSISEKFPWFPPHLLHPEISAHCLSPPPDQQFSNFSRHRHHQKGLLKCSL